MVNFTDIARMWEADNLLKESEYDSSLVEQCAIPLISPQCSNVRGMPSTC